MSAPISANAFANLPPVPAPPNDPDSLLLDARVGWNIAALDGVEPAPCDGALTLSLQADAQRTFVEPSGSLGGLTLPSNMALAADGSLFLLDRRGLELKRFDPCTCRFVRVPCLGGRHRHAQDESPSCCDARQPVAACADHHGDGPRGLRNPHGIAICGDTLYVCDTGRDGLTASGPNPRWNALRERIRRENHRVAMFALDGFSLRGHLRPPQDKYPHWRPFSVACDSRGCVWVTDTGNARLHRFDRLGRWREAIAGFAQPTHIAIDRRDRIYVVQAAIGGMPATLVVLDTDGRFLPVPQRVADTKPFFKPPPFDVRADGILDLRARCVNPGAHTGWFDPRGHELAPSAIPKPISNPFLTSGTYLSSALDSKTSRCQWHRILVDGDIPAGTRVRIETFCADEIYDADQLAGFAQWARRELPPPPLGDRGAAKECLVASPPGRYLWLRITLLGNGGATPVLRALVIEFPRITSLRYLPAVFAAEPTSADFSARFLALFDATLSGIERTLDTQAGFFDPRSSPSRRVGDAKVDFLTWLATWIGVRFDRSWSDAKRRQFLKRIGAILDWRGSVRGLREMLLLVLGWNEPRACRDAAPRKVCGCRPLNCAPPPERPCYQPPPLILEHFKLRRWLLLGHARLGAQAVLWGNRIANRSQLGVNAEVGHTQITMVPDPLHDPFRFYANRYSVFVPACVGRDPAARKSLENLLRSETPASVRWIVEYVEPRFRIGVQSMIGFDSVIGALPSSGVRLGGAKLGEATLLTGAPAPAIRVGRRGRIGTGARVN